MRRGDRELHSLVRADRPAEHDALAGIPARRVDEPASVADALRRDQHSLGVHAVEDVVKAAALLADQPVGGHLDLVEEDLGRCVVHHRLDRADRQPVTGLAQVDEEHGEAVAPLCDFVRRSRAREQDHQV